MSFASTGAWEKTHPFLRRRMKSPLNLCCDAQETNCFINSLAQEGYANSKVQMPPCKQQGARRNTL